MRTGASRNGVPSANVISVGRVVLTIGILNPGGGHGPIGVTIGSPNVGNLIVARDTPVIVYETGYNPNLLYMYRHGGANGNVLFAD